MKTCPISAVNLKVLKFSSDTQIDMESKTSVSSLKDPCTPYEGIACPKRLKNAVRFSFWDHPKRKP